MAVLVDYRCTGCGAVAERWAPSPPPPAVSCGSCGRPAGRVWAAVGLSGAGRPTEPPVPPVPPVPPATHRRRPLCSRYPQVPGLCHMSESAGRVWLARYAGDNRALDRELEHQRTRLAGSTPSMPDAVTHRHAGS